MVYELELGLSFYPRHVTLTMPVSPAEARGYRVLQWHTPGPTATGHAIPARPVSPGSTRPRNNNNKRLVLSTIFLVLP